MRNVTFVLPGDVDDPAVASGGNVYGRRMCEQLGATRIAVPGTWPEADPASLAEALAAVPDGEIVIIDGLVACGWPQVVGPAARRLLVAVIVHLPLGDEAGRDPALAADLDAREWTTLHAVGAIVATSAWSAQRLVEHHVLDANRVHVVAPGTDPAPLATGTDGRSRLLCVAAVTPHKGQDLLVEALAELEDLPWTCACVGPLLRDPAFVDRVHELIEARGLAGRVVLAGPQAGDELEASYAAADLVVLPSRAETYGMVVAEALMRGIPVLAAAVGAVPNTLGRASDGRVPGILLPQRDPAAFAGALRRWLTDPDLSDRLRTSARDRRRTLPDWAEAARKLSTVLDHLESTWAA
jgi:glycosyltransferase involved in cell wall biosynthesis